MQSPGFIRLLEDAVGEERARVVLEALSQSPSASIRLNPSKIRECPFEGASKVAWSPYGYILQDRPVFTLDPLFHAGCYYVQDSSAMFVGWVFRQALELFDNTHLNVLDLCAAPGGKTTDLASSLRERQGDEFSLVANEVMKKRFAVLRTNVRTWGDPRVGVVSKDPSAFREKGVYDIIVADVPCSGEGMFRKDEKAVEDWSEDTVSFCAARQRRIISDIWPSLKDGGIMIYSTCTFNKEENDVNVGWVAGELGAEILDFGDVEGVIKTCYGYSLLPGFVPGEGQYAAALRKDGEYDPTRRGSALSAAEVPAVDIKDYPRVEVDLPLALDYLHGDALRLPDAPSGMIYVCYKGQVLGEAKNIGSRCNNLYPKENRIRMNVK